MKQADILIIHDQADIALLIAEKLSNDDIIKAAEEIAYADSPTEGLEKMRLGLQPKTVILHKGLGHATDLEPFVETMRKINGENTRLGIVSGEFFAAQVCKTALTLGANFGWDLTDHTREGGTVPDWVVKMAQLGYLYPQELELTGKEIVLTALKAKERLELLGANRSHPERM